uniref:Transmembrane protein n=1 Tax=Opuntia streptacantha TaxID=393608 RepID=A0A7C8Z022_OPUST
MEMGRWRGFGLREMGDGEASRDGEMEKLQLWDEGDKEMGCNFLTIKFFILFFLMITTFFDLLEIKEKVFFFVLQKVDKIINNLWCSLKCDSEMGCYCIVSDF